jgi:DNA/RNA-binding domain of Phe-tRNA-synthetase-like protein
MRFAIDPAVFAVFPEYRRGIVVAQGVTNALDDAALAERLREAERAARDRVGSTEWRNEPRLAAWAQAFQQLGIGVSARPPAVVALAKRVLKGGELPFINQLVALMNITSLEHLLPVGGDDLHAVGGELVLRPAAGHETYRPLGHPDVVEHPDAGEIVLVDTANAVVLCRCWCWRNSDPTKITEGTTAVALNIDVLPPAVPADQAAALTARLAADLTRHCGGEAVWHVLTRDDLSFAVDV